MIPLKDNIPSSRFAFVTYGLILVNVLVFFHEITLSRPVLDHLFRSFGFVPARFVSRLGQGALLPAFLPMLTSLFLHGGWLHLIGNMWVLHIFGDNVEDTLGHGRFLLLYLICGLVACLAQMLGSPASRIPMVGASGAIAGVMGAYFSLFPGARVLTWIPPLIFLIIEVPAYVFLGLWFLLQFFSGTLSIAGHQAAGGVAFFAHVGGFIVGMALLWFLLPPRGREGSRPSPRS